MKPANCPRQKNWWVTTLVLAATATEARRAARSIINQARVSRVDVNTAGHLCSLQPDTFPPATGCFLILFFDGRGIDSLAESESHLTSHLAKVVYLFGAK